MYLPPRNLIYPVTAGIIIEWRVNYIILYYIILYYIILYTCSYL